MTRQVHLALFMDGRLDVGEFEHERRSAVATGDGGYLIYRIMPSGGGARAKKANSGVAEKAFMTNCRSAPFFVPWRECSGSVP